MVTRKPLKAQLKTLLSELWRCGPFIRPRIGYVCWHLSPIRCDFQITARGQTSCVNWTDGRASSIFSKSGQRNTIDFSSAGGLRNSLLSQEGHVPNDFVANTKYLRMPVSRYLGVCIWWRASVGEEDGQHGAGNLGHLVVFRTFLGVRQTRPRIY